MTPVESGREDKAIRHPHRRALVKFGGDDDSPAKKAGAPYQVAPAWLAKIKRYCAGCVTIQSASGNSAKQRGFDNGNDDVDIAARRFRMGGTFDEPCSPVFAGLSAVSRRVPSHR
ncbi:hypothetical protein P0D88_34420 [Paraburkholderia sp. RL18-103-BIB-C]|jgi:hypothetical protein|uniref:hypothetical protein n=1 Tax=unclassified Paraburkholderia TaxID=2615204 RepID=UPI0038B9C7D0